ncbi:MAG: hypothetical protein NC252_05160 [Roseburia sp.]|nr:hypothetical protein [Roseburia sp.]
MNRTLPRLQKRDSTATSNPQNSSRQIEQSIQPKDIKIPSQTCLPHPKAHKSPKLQGAENLFTRHTDFFRKVHEIYFQGAQNFQSPFFDPKSGIFQNHSLIRIAVPFSMLRKTKMEFEPGKRQF